MRSIVGAVGDGAHSGKRHTIVQAYLGDGGAFHFYGQHVVARLAQRGAQPVGLVRGRDKAVATGHQAVVHLLGSVAIIWI